MTATTVGAAIAAAVSLATLGALGEAAVATAAPAVPTVLRSPPDLRPPGGPYLPPMLPLRVEAAFDPPAQRWQPGHRGVDLVAAGEGASVRAAAAGTVTFAGTVVDRGVVTIDHGGLSTTYEPLTPTVVQGQTVAAGDQIGTISAGAHCSQRCLHWGALLEERYIDPMALLTTYRPILKPPLPSARE